MIKDFWFEIFSLNILKCYCIVVLPLMLLFVTSDVSLISWVCDLQFPSRRFWNFCLSFLVYSVSECSSFPVLFGPWIHIHWFILSFSKYLLEVYCVPGCIPHTLIWDLWSFLSSGKLLVIFSNIFSSFFFSSGNSIIWILLLLTSLL